MANRSLGNETNPPEGAKGWVQQVMEASQRAEEAASMFPKPSSEDAGKSIAVGEDGRYHLKKVTGGEFYPIGDGLKIVDGNLAVDVADAVEEDNTKPVTSGAVAAAVGNIDALLQTI